MLASQAMHASRFLLGALALSFMVAGLGCKTGKGGTPPVASPIYTFTAPEREDVFPDESETEEEEGAGDEDFATEE